MYLKEGIIDKTYTVLNIALPSDLKRRLEALGMTVGANVEVIDRKGKGILIIKLRGTNFALGFNITKSIEVEPYE